MLYHDRLETIDNSQSTNSANEIQNPGSQLINCGPEKIWRETNYDFLRKCFFREKDSSTLTNVNK